MLTRKRGKLEISSDHLTDDLTLGLHDADSPSEKMFRAWKAAQRNERVSESEFLKREWLLKSLVFSRELKLAYLPIRQNGTRFFKRTILKHGSLWKTFCDSGLDEHHFAERSEELRLSTLEEIDNDAVRFAIVQHPVRRAYSSYVDQFLATNTSEPARQLMSLGESAGCPSSNGRPFSFREFVAALLQANDADLPAAFRSQAASIDAAQDILDWIVPLQRHPQFLTMLEEHTGRRISPRKVRLGYKTESIAAALRPWDLHADHLRTRRHFPDFNSLVQAELAAELESRFAADLAIYDKACQSFGKPQIQNKLSEIYHTVRQISSKTSADRYPEVFRHVADFLTAQPRDDLNLLSFGCSTGEECEALGEYFPDAKIVGLDIRQENIAKGKSRVSDERIVFDFSNDDNLHKHGPYDAIFAMSVFCRWPDTMYVENCADYYPFEMFDHDINRLASCLKRGGLMVVFNANFRIEDTQLATRFCRIELPSLNSPEFVTKFSTENRRLDCQRPFAIYQLK